MVPLLTSASAISILSHKPISILRRKETATSAVWRLWTEPSPLLSNLSVKAPPFFLATRKGTGLSAKECEICDFFVYIPQYGCGTASLNVTVAASIVLHHFGAWAGFVERSREGNKFLVAERSINQVKRNICSEPIESVIEERRTRREFGLSDVFKENGIDQSLEVNLLGVLFDS
ncbi:hypothetical protein HPP92_015478 [Vanilla planifolia]|uniref:tRNA/rRNA methyltransferase SpoU type domain-containing protein n=1 Tax=Vanilla planifolia TaxID=51239 RepID=A0A835UVQ8_VANPL|nr:hypothetical protein HPP92_015478 [Vanilla planifolia]